MAAHATTLLVATALLASCGSRTESGEKTPPDNTLLRFGTLHLAEWNAQGALQATPPHVASTPFEPQSSNATPLFGMVQGERPIAEFIPDIWRLRDHPKPAPYQTPATGCPATQTLLSLVEEMGRIALQKSVHTNIPAALLATPTCEQQPLLDCFLRRIRAEDWSRFSTQLSRGIALKSLVSNLGSCDGNTERWRTRHHFEIVGQRIFFSPDPVYSIRIFEGTYTSYTYANDNFDSVARLIDLGCSGNCFVSPQPLKRLFTCASCQKLEKGREYTAFLQLSRAENEENFVPITFRLPK
jgi:hypothetical protein